MDKQLFMAVDLGTSFIKTAVYDSDGNCLGGTSEPVRDERPAPGIFLQRGDFCYEAVIGCLKHTADALGERSRDVCAMAFTGQMAGSMGVDENWNDITTWSCSLDSRYLPYADEQREKFGDEMFSIGGTSAPVMCAKYAWFKDAFPKEHSKIAKYVMLGSYIIGRLSRIPVDEAKIDYSLITWTGMSDIKNRCWSETLCEKMGIDRALLPKIVSCTDIGGSLCEEEAKKIGLPAGIPLIVGAGDKVSGCTGAGIFDEGDMIFEAASYGAISCKVKHAILDEEKRNYDVIGSIDNESYYIHKYIQGSGISIDWFVDHFIREESMTKKEAFAKADMLAQEIKIGSDRMLAIGLLSGSAIPFDSELRGAFMGHTWAHGKGHFYRALLEGFSYDLALTLKSIEKAYPHLKGSTVKLIGGGAKSTVWPQMLSDVTGHEFALLSREDVALWGAALLAAKGIGAIDDIAARAQEKVTVKKVFSPNEEQNKIYEKYISLYEEFTIGLHGLFEKLNRI